MDNHDLTQSFSVDTDELARWEAGEDREKFGARVLVGDDLESKEWINLTQAEVEALLECPASKWNPCWGRLERAGLLWVYDNSFSSEPRQARLTNKGRAVIKDLEANRG